MPPDPKTTQPPAPAAGEPAPPAGGGLEDRVNGLEAEQKRQGGMLEQILAKLPGKAPAAGAPDPDPSGKSVAELVREGIEKLEADKAAKAKADADEQARQDHAARIKALEELAPAENAATPVGAFRAGVQRVMFGITDPHK